MIYKEPWGSKALARYVSVSTSKKKRLEKNNSTTKENIWYTEEMGRKILPMLEEKQETRNNCASQPLLDGEQVRFTTCKIFQGWDMFLVDWRLSKWNIPILDLVRFQKSLSYAAGTGEQIEIRRGGGGVEENV